MIKRYMTSDMKQIWNYEQRMNYWLMFQVDLCQAWFEHGLIPESDYLKIKNNIKLDLPLMEQLEVETKHDVVAFTRMLSASLGTEKKWVHFGITSTDMVDSAQNYQIKLANEVINNKVKLLQEQLKSLAFKYENLLIMGRTHGIFGEPTSLGFKFALWYDELNRQMVRFQLAREQVEVVKITGSLGNFAHVSPDISAFIAQKWKMKPDYSATQVVARDRLINLVTVLANIATTIEKIALEIRLSSRSEVQELLEGFDKNQKGSSSMPHKKNPVGSENISGMARLIRSYCSAVYDNNLLWYERDMSHSSNERVILPDLYYGLDFIITRITSILKNLVVNEEAIKDNIDKANNLFFSQPILLSIIKNNKTVSREQAYDFVQNCSLEAQLKNVDFKLVLQENKIEQYLTKEQLEECYNINNFIKEIKFIFNKIFNS